MNTFGLPILARSKKKGSRKTNLIFLRLASLDIHKFFQKTFNEVENNVMSKIARANISEDKSLILLLFNSLIISYDNLNDKNLDHGMR